GLVRGGASPRRTRALASLSTTLLERAPGYDHPRAAPAQGVPPQRGGIVRQYDQRDEDIFGVAEGAFTCADAACGGNELEAVSTEQACHLAVTLRAGGQQSAAQGGNIVKIGARGGVTHQLLQRMLEAHMHLPRPGNRCPLLRHGRDLLVPQMKVDEALAATAGRAIREREIPLEPADSDAQNTGGIAGIFDDGVPVAQGA